MAGSVQEFLDRLAQAQDIQFSETLAVIERNYRYIPVTFYNGLGDDRLTNDAGTNEGSCKIFAFARLNDLSESDTLQLFGDYYRIDVLLNPEQSTHMNIRTFMKFGWAGIEFPDPPLEVRLP